MKYLFLVLLLLAVPSISSASDIEGPKAMAQVLILAKGYTCDSVSYMKVGEDGGHSTIQVFCNNHRYKYKIIMMGGDVYVFRTD